MVLTLSQAMKFYDRFGAKQDGQSFYEDAAIGDLVVHAAFGQASNVFELGCGTGRFASRLLSKHLAPEASYLGIDVSGTMIEIAGKRISPYAGRARVVRSDGSLVFPVPDHSADRVVSTYVLDLLSEADIQKVISEAIRVLEPGGKLCLAGLTHGATMVSRVVSQLWSVVFRLHAPLVGGCRPIRVESFVSQERWEVQYGNVVIQFGVPSEILIASAV
jgi:ubiquinone/menaquinone biosynthesis C-methylase UbiE